MNGIIIIIFFIGVFFLILRLRKKKQEGIDKCSKCGKELGKLDINFCRYCGTKLSAPKKGGSILKILIIIIAVILILTFFIGSFAAQTSIRRIQPPMYEQPFEAPGKFQVERIEEVPYPYIPEPMPVPEEYPYSTEPMPVRGEEWGG